MNGKPALGRLERVALRDVWKSESSDFTPWLAREENLKVLGDAIGLELELEAQEKEVGPFRADILCKDTATNTWVLIENQLERTDHTHLGQLLTYAAGLDAVTLVWVAERFTAEHRAAFDWLNELGSEKLRCFGLEIELWRIGASPAAPKFNVVSQPNDWARSFAATAAQIESGANTATKQLQLEFWQAFQEHLRESSKILRPTKPLPQHWMNLALGRTGVKLAAIAAAQSSTADAEDGELRAEVCVEHHEFAKAWFAELEAQRAALEAEIGATLTWHNPPGKRACRIYVRRAASIDDRTDWANQHRWLREQLEQLHAAFGPRVKALPGTSAGPASDPNVEGGAGP
jgi:hypothetical protein